LARDDYEVHLAEDGEQALNILKEHHVDLLITDLRMPKIDGMELLRQALELDPNLPVILLTAHGTIDNAVEALKTGAFDYITKPFDQTEVRNIVQKAIRTRELASEDIAPTGAQPKDSDLGIIGESAAIAELRKFVSRLSDTATHVVITGESGTGKELLARALHATSSRRNGPFIKVNCAAVAAEHLETELFGFESRSGSGPVSAKPGRLELAHGGCLFLDEVDRLDAASQVRLLGTLADGQFERVGGIQARVVDARLIVASRGELLVQVKQGTFREDLHLHLGVAKVRCPPLRERTDDIASLALHFAIKFSRALGKVLAAVSPDALACLCAYPWPGNVRELEHVIERAVLFSDGPVLTRSDLPRGIQEPALADGDPGNDYGLREQVKAAMSRLERELIDRALAQTKGNVTHAARLLKISRKGLQLKMKELGLRERDDRAD
jgi:DNA-binding NtrC family response regulator